ncbi:Non-specific serine/threonine protein kinase protein [Dioscorea alata]|uniref:Non-specific serine/threonine protein kinase protein n=1 Tax=Dioscorea alata TaxID=55571 RepID=A0ACB7V3G9_DIOAL|nr:Non-specific serine/threonine protein kinase protein [Dioscorea alata]
MASANYKASPPFLRFHFTQQEVSILLSLLLLCLAFMMPFITSTSTGTGTATATATATASDSSTKGCIKAERDALLAFKAQIIHYKAHPISSWGDQSDNCCHWAGIRCDNNTGHVFRLELQRRRPRQYYPDNYYDLDYYIWNPPKCDEWDLSGNISESLIGLQHLTYLDLSNNCFHNISIPKFLGSLENLVHLDLSSLGFTGIIPHELGNLTRLRYLKLATSYYFYERLLKVDDAEWLSGLSSLRYLSMDGVDFYGVNNVMQSLNKLRHLKSVSLVDCSMNIIPESLPHLNFTSLTFMNIERNMFDNTSISEWLFKIPNLRELYMYHDGFTGAIPSSVGNATSLQFLDLSENSGISGDMPREFGDLCNLQSLHLDDTFIGKSLEEDFRDALSGCIRRNLNVVSFKLSGLQGPLPNWLGEFRNLTMLDLSYNSFNSSIPASIGKLSRLQQLHLYGNALIGSIPSSIGNATSLQFMDLSWNGGISGDMPRGFGDLCNLQTLHLDGTFVGKSLEDFRDAFSGCIRRNLNELSFQGSSLQGPLPDWLGEFQNLTFLDLSYNSFNNPIPASIGRLPQLQVLYLYSSGLNGSIPKYLGRLSRLHSLDLSNNALTGSIPVSSGTLSGLQSLDLSNNALTGSIPVSIGRLSELEYLDLSFNDLEGSIPESLGRLSSLYVLNFRANDLNGPIPESLSQLSRLVTVGLSDNNFNYSSVITEAHLANLTNLKYLYLDHLVLNISNNWIPRFQAIEIGLSYCRVGTKFPVWLANQVNLDYLDISNTGIKDSIHDWFWNITYTMSYLSLSNNDINGRLPHRLKFQANNRVSIFLGSNHFEGSIPYFPPNVYALDLGNNSFSGIIPSDLGNFGGMQPQLTFLSLSSNDLIGIIPNSLCNLVDLVLLELSNNHIEGAIPSCWNNLTDLQYLILANNSLIGEVPNSLISSSKSLQVLHLSNNQLHGEFPSFLKKCTSMTTLALDHNNFSGNIPQSYGNLMGMINISMNGGARFSSNISEVLVITMTVSTKGEDLQYGVILSSFKFIDLSANKLSGQIPKEIVNLVGLQNLDLSCNKLSGEIPSNIGLMQSLESLNLSRNELIGSIPPGLSTINFLGSLNLSHNNLSGKIPYTKHLTTFNDPSIYAGNLYLCGAPLDKNCTSDEPTSNSQANGQEDDDNDSLPIWFYLGLMPGFVVGFWIVWGILLFKQEWRHLYFKYLDHMYDMMHVKIMIIVPKIKRWFFVMRSM